MSIFLDIEPVPFRLLEDLMMRMEANNDRMRERMGEKGSTERPSPQRPAHNAEGSTYRRPEPAASPRGGGIAVIGHEFVEDTFSGPEAISSRWRLTTLDGSTLEYEMPYATVGPVPYWEDTSESTIDISGGELFADTFVWYADDGIGPRVEVTTSTVRYVRIVFEGALGVYLVPTGQDSGLLIHLSSSAKSYTRDTEYNYQYRGFRKTGETTFDPDGNLLYQAEFVASRTKEQIEAVTIGPAYVANVKAFVFNRRTVREVPAGEGVQAALDFWHPSPIIDDQRIELYEAPSDTFAGFTGSRGYHQVSVVNNGQMPRNLFRNYGFRRISALGDGGTTTFSPAVYAMFQNYQSVSSPSETSSSNPVLGATRDYSNATAKLVELGSPLPALFVEPRREAPVPGPMAYYSTRTPPASTSESVPEALMRRYPASKPGKAVVPSGGPGIFYQLWDWQKPGYCRQQAVSLGFAPGDLTP
jgi:hypothetical protein